MASFPYKANYPGDCGSCNGPYIKGDLIIWANGRTIHVGCLDEYEEQMGLDEMNLGHSSGAVNTGPIKLLRPACPKCHLELPKSMVCGNC